MTVQELIDELSTHEPKNIVAIVIDIEWGKVVRTKDVDQIGSSNDPKGFTSIF